MKVRLGNLRALIWETLANSGRFPGQPMRNALSPDINSREQIGIMSAKDMDVGDDDGLPEHLREPTLTPEECFGPVPPVAEEPYVGQDPFVRDASPHPFSTSG